MAGLHRFVGHCRCSVMRDEVSASERFDVTLDVTAAGGHVQRTTKQTYDTRVRGKKIAAVR